MEIVSENNKYFGIAVKAMIINDCQEVLVTYKTKEEAKNDPNPDFRRDQPGGRLVFGEDPEEALKREVLEEVNLIVKVIAPIQVWHYVKGGFQLVGINFICELISGSVQLGNEHEAYEWLTRDEVIKRDWDDKEDYLRAFEYIRSGENRND